MNEFLKNKNIEIKYSDIIAIFTMVVGTKRITKFLEHFPELNYKFDEFAVGNLKLKEKFNKILNQYKIDKNYNLIFPKKENTTPTAKISLAFLTVPSSVSNPKYNLPVVTDNRKSFEKKKQETEKYILKEQIKSLENFIAIYQLFYDDTTKIEQKDNVKMVVKQIINNKNNVIKCMEFILDKFGCLSHIFKEDDFCEYFTKFCSDIKDLKYFYLLSIKNYSNQVIKIINNWLMENINTFSKEKEKNILKGMKNHFRIMLDKKSNAEAQKLLDALKDKIGETYENLIIDLLKSLENINNKPVAEKMISSYLFPNEKDKTNIDDKLIEKVKKFTEIKPNKLIIEIFLSEIENLYISQNDFYNKTTKFELFKILLNDDNYSVLSKENKNNKSKQYWKESKSTCDWMIKNLQELKITYFDIKKAISFYGGEEEMYRNITLLIQCIEKDIKTTNDIKNKIDKAKEKIENNTKAIEKLKEYNVFINIKNPEINKKLSEYNIKIMDKKPLGDIFSDKEFSKYEKDILNAKEKLALKNSIIFVNIFNKLKKKKEGMKALEE